LILPASCSVNVDETPSVGPSSRAAERAGKRLQTVTKEVDWRIAKAYVALAEDDDGSSKKEEGKLVPVDTAEALETLAIDRYLDDAEWEESERRAGRGVSIQRFPFGDFDSKQDPSHEKAAGFRWPWSVGGAS
jgi:hypothetical protein